MNRVYPQRYNWHKDNNVVVKSKYNKEYNKEYKLFIQILNQSPRR